MLGLRSLAVTLSEAALRVWAAHEGTAPDSQPQGLVVRASYSGQAGHPVLFERGVWAELEKLEGDRGARDLLAGHRDWVVDADLSGEPPSDVDSWDDYQRILSRHVE